MTQEESLAQTSYADAAIGRVRKFDRAWNVLAAEDRTHYWDFAASEVQSFGPPKGPPRAESHPYDGLCAAVQAIDGRSQSKGGIVGLPRTTKRLSGDELQKGIRRLKDRLFGNVHAQAFLEQVFSRWVQLYKLPALLRCLDAVGCKHDEVGNLLGSMPQLDEEGARKAILPLTEELSAYDLMVVCAGLGVNNCDWAPLWNVIPELEQEIARQNNPNSGDADPQLPIADMEFETDADLDPPSSDNSLVYKDLPQVNAAGLNIAQLTLNRLREGLRDALVEVESGLVPHRNQIVDDLLFLEHWIGEANLALGMQTRELHLVGRALADADTSLRYRQALTKLECVQHASDPNYDAHLAAVQDAHQALALIDTNQLDKAETLISPLLSLLALIEHGDGLDDETASHHDDVVRKSYGARLAISAHRGTLRLCSAKSAVSADALSIRSPTAVLGQTSQQLSAPAVAVYSAQEAMKEPEPEPEPASELSESPEPEPAGVQELGQKNELLSGNSFAPKIAMHDEANSTVNIAAAHAIPEEIPNATSSGHLALERIANSTNKSELPFAQSLAEFKNLAWINKSGCVEVAPWTRAGFDVKLRTASLNSWDEGRIGLSYLFGVAGQARNDAPEAINLDDLAAADKLLENPADLVNLRDSQRSARLHSWAGHDVAVGDRSASLALVLEALAPTHPVAWSADEARSLCHSVSLGSPQLGAALVFLLTGWSSAGDPLGMIRAHLKDAKPDAQAITADLKSAQSELQRLVATLWNAAGGRIVHTHCKKAWTQFVRDHVVPLRDGLAPQGSQKRQPELSTKQAFQRIAEMARAFQTVMNDGGVRHGDRSAAQAGAEQIVAGIERVVEFKAQLESAGRKQSGSIAIPRNEIDQLMRELPSESKQRLCVLLLRAAWTEEAQQNPLRVPAAYLRKSPDLVRAMSSNAVAAQDLHRGIPVSGFSDVLLAAALLLDEKSEPPDFAERSQVLELVRNAGIDNDRADLLAALVPAGCLQSHEKTQLHRRALELGNSAYQSTETLQGIWTACDDLLASRASSFRRFIDEAQEASSFSAGEAPIADTLLVQAWLDRGIIEANFELASVIKVRSDEADRRTLAIGKQFTKLIDAKDYRSAMALFHPEQTNTELEENEPVRVTMWRTEAIRRFPNPRTTLLSELKGATSEQSSLVSWWVSPGDNDATYRDTLRRALYNVISGEAGHSMEVNKRRFGGKLAELRVHKDRKTIVRCSILREYFQASKLNPTFLPQLADFDEVVLATLPTSAQAANAVDAYIRAASADGPRVLSVFLEPNVSPARRDEVSSMLRKRRVPAVILDDIDICRLCVIGADAQAHNFIPFLEIVFEQLDLELISPFSSQDGQHIRLESFVGRLSSAEAIARGWEYSRLFSGRKLGKSAFLRYLASKYDNTHLPSGKTLRVIFISIAGASSESSVVDAVIHEMTRKFNLWPEGETSVFRTPVERFGYYMSRFAGARKDDNVLVILDEADAFVEEQLRNYDRVRDKSLSFYMMKRMPDVEGTDMPRVRFLFAGYRVTNTRGGVWANAGDVLILQPLTEDEAVSFLRGMLARVGVDLGSHARFAARRCGYQPAVLIRFGDCLLRRLRRSLRTSMREHYSVSYDDVIATMSDQSVMEEIRTVVNNNFQGNRVAAAVFAATLLALKDLEPGMALEGGQQHVLNKLQEIDSDTTWLAGQGADPLAQVDRQLQEFIDRELLVATDGPRFGIRVYRLKFPHFMPILEQQDLTLEVRQHIRYLRSSDAPARLVESVLPDASLEAIRYVYKEGKSQDCPLVIAAGHWREALTDVKVGIADRLGCNPRMLATAQSQEEIRLKSQSYRIFRDVDGSLLSAFAQTENKETLLLMGGVDLLRSALIRQLEGSDYSIDVRPFAPMSRATLAWWFEGARALVFKSADVVDSIFAATQGIPILVQALSEQLNDQSGMDVPAANFAQALSRYEAELPSIAQRLKEGPTHVRLSEREIELLRMVRRVSREIQPEFDLQTELPMAWEMCSVGSGAAPFMDERDRASLQLLLNIGLLPADRGTAVGTSGALGRVNFEQGSALSKLLDALGPICAT